MRKKGSTKRILAWALAAAMTVSMLLGDAIPSYAAAADGADGYDVVTDADTYEPVFEADASDSDGVVSAPDAGDVPDVYDDIEDAFDASVDAVYGAADEEADSAGFDDGEALVDEDTDVASEIESSGAVLDDDEIDVEDSDEDDAIEEETAATIQPAGTEYPGDKTETVNKDATRYGVFVNNENNFGENGESVAYWTVAPASFDSTATSLHEPGDGEEVDYDYFVYTSEVNESTKLLNFSIVPVEGCEKIPAIDTAHVTISYYELDDTGETLTEHKINDVSFISENNGYRVIVGDPAPTAGGDFVINIPSVDEQWQVRLKTEVNREFTVNPDAAISMTYSYKVEETDPETSVTLNKMVEYAEDTEHDWAYMLAPSDADMDTYPGYQWIPYGATVTIAKADITYDDYHRIGWPEINCNGGMDNESPEKRERFNDYFRYDHDNEEVTSYQFVANDDMISDSDHFITVKPLIWDNTELRLIDGAPESMEETDPDRWTAGSYDFGLDLYSYIPADMVKKFGNTYLLNTDISVLMMQFDPAKYSNPNGSTYYNDAGYKLTALEYAAYNEYTEWVVPEPTDDDPNPEGEDVPHKDLLDTGRISIYGNGPVTISGSQLENILNSGANVIECKPVANTHYNTVTITHAQLCTATVRKGSESLVKFTSDADSDKYFVADGSTLSVSVSPWLNCKIKDATVIDSTTGAAGKKISPKNGEYTIKVGKKDASLTLTGTKSIAVIVESGGQQIKAVKGKYPVNTLNGFTATLYDGNTVVGAEDALLKVDGTDTPIDGLNASYECSPLEKAGKTVTVEFTYPKENGTKYTANITVSGAINGIKVAGENSAQELSVKYGISSTAKITPDPKKANVSGTSAWIVEGGNPVRKIDFGTYDGKTLKIDGSQVVKNYKPGDIVTYRFLAGEDSDCEPIDADHKIKITGALTSKLTPVVKKNAAGSTIHEIGLTLSLPKGVNAKTAGMYYEITATASEEDQQELQWFLDSAPEEYLELRDPTNLYKIRTNLNDWDYGTKSLIPVYKPALTAYIPVSQKSASICVLEDQIKQKVEDSEDGWDQNGWAVDYEVTARLVYVQDIDADPVTPVKDGTDSVICSADSKKAVSSTKDQKYETKLKLTKKAPKKIYTGQNGVNIAVAKYNSATSVRGLDRIVLTNSDGANWGGYYIHDPDRDNDDRFGWVKYDNATGVIKLDTTHERIDGEGHPYTEYLEPGTYTVTAYTIAGMDKSVSATVKFTVVGSIGELKFSQDTATVYKSYGKAVTVKNPISYSGIDEWSVATKKVKWYLSEFYDKSTGNFESRSISGVKVNQKNGNLTLDKKMTVYSHGRSFYVVAQASDYSGNTVTAGKQITIKAQATAPASIKLMHEDYDYEHNVLRRADDSGIRNNQKDVNTSQASYVNPYAYDADGNLLDPSQYTITVSGLTKLNEDRPKYKVNKVGKTTVKATATDGSKKSCTLTFTTVYADKTATLWADIQTGARDLDWDYSILNEERQPRASEDDPRGDLIEGNLDFAYNDCPITTPIYFSVSGCYNPDRGDDKQLIKHSITVNGGTKPTTLYGDGSYDNAVTYKFFPTSFRTTVTITNLTQGAADYNKSKKYTIYNLAFADNNNTAAYKVTPEKKDMKIYNEVDIRYTEGDAIALPNIVYYKLNGISATATHVLLSVDDPGRDGNKWNFGRYLTATYDGRDFDQVKANGKLVKIVRNGNEAGISLDFYEDQTDEAHPEDHHIHMDRIKPGKYTFYVTVGEEGEDPDGNKWFYAHAKPTKITLTVAKAPAPKVSPKTINAAVPAKAHDDGGFFVNYPTTTGLRIDPYMDFVGNSTKGQASDFRGIFEIERVSETDGSVKIYENEVGGKTVKQMKILVNEDAFVRVYIKGEEHWMSLREIQDLKNGKSDVEWWAKGKKFPAKDQKQAYKDFVKRNTTGYIEVRPTSLNGKDYPAQFITVKLPFDTYMAAAFTEPYEEPEDPEP